MAWYNAKWNKDKLLYKLKNVFYKREWFCIDPGKLNNSNNILYPHYKKPISN